MAVSSLESIAEKLAEAKKQRLEEILSVSGSNAIVKSENGITTVSDDNVASSLVFKPLNRVKYDNNEILKAVDVEISELRPDIPVPVKDLVPKPIYDAEVKTNEDLRLQIQQLNINITDLNTQISSLRAELETEINNKLALEQSNDALNNQTETLTSTINDFTNQIQSSLQKSVEESVLRGSLQSQNTGFRAQIEALIKQIDSLNSMVEGLQSQLGSVQQQQNIQQSSANLAASAGGDAINDALIVTGIKDGIIGRINNKNRNARFDRGNFVDLKNNDIEPITVTITVNNHPGQNWLQGPKEKIVLKADEQRRFEFGFCVGCCSFGKKDRSTGYDGKVNVAVVRSDGSSQSKDYGTRINIMHPKSY
jgi:hypothetical protein